jgi:glutamyl-tRNA synthetase
MIWSALGHEPPVWAHVPVLVNETRKKLSKRRDKVALEMFRDEGYLASAMVNYLMTLGWTPKGDSEICAWDQMESDFRLEDVNHSPAFFDLKKLAAFNGDHIRMLSPEAFVEACMPWLTAPDVPYPAERLDRALVRAMAPHIQPRCVTLADAPALLDFFFVDEPVVDPDAWAKATATDEMRAVLVESTDAYGAVAEWTAASLKDLLERIGESHGLKLGKAQASIRVAVTGRAVGPPLFESLEFLGRERTLARLHGAVLRLA